MQNARQERWTNLVDVDFVCDDRCRYRGTHYLALKASYGEGVQGFHRHKGMQIRTLCCLSQMLFDCGAVEMWQHTKKGTYHFKNPTDCDNTYTVCYPYNNPYIP
jgi:hypothetical protein